MVRSRSVSFFLIGGVFVLLAGGAASACSSDAPKRPDYAGEGRSPVPIPVGSSEGGVEGGADAGDSGSRDGGDGGVCSEIALTGTLVDRVGVIGDPPVSSGGPVADGTYDLTLYSVYVGNGGVAGPTGLTARSTIRVAAGKLEQVLEIGGSSPVKTTRSKGAYTAAGATLAISEFCPNLGGGSQRQFTANDPQLILTDLVTKEAFTFVKR